MAYCHQNRHFQTKKVDFDRKTNHFSDEIESWFLKWHPFLLQQRLWYHLSKIWYILDHRDYHLSFLHFEFCLVHCWWISINVLRTEKVLFGHHSNFGDTRRYSRLFPWFKSRNKFTSSLFDPVSDEFNFFAYIRGHYCPHKL